MLTNTEQDARAVGAWPLDEDKPAHTGLGHPAPPLRAGTAARQTLNDMGSPGPGAEASLLVGRETCAGLAALERHMTQRLFAV